MKNAPDRSISRSVYRTCVATLMFALCTGAAVAGDISFLAGANQDDQSVLASYDSRPVWRRDFMGHPLDIHFETSVGRVMSSSGSGDKALGHVGLTPFAQYWFRPDTAVELGIGLNLFSGTRLGDKTISTAFQFGDSLGVFHRLADSRWTVGMRFTHYSNADIKRPNPGQDYLLLRVSYSLD